MDGQGRLAVLVGGEVLRLGCGDGFVARDDALDQAAHGFNTERQWNHIEQQQITGCVVAGELMGLDGGAQRHYFVRIQIGQGCARKIIAYRTLYLRHTGRAADHDHALHVTGRELGIAQRPAH